MPCRPHHLLLPALLAALAPAPAQAQSSYTVAEIPLPPGQTDGTPYHIGPDGRIVVQSYNPSVNASRSYIFDHGTYTDIGTYQGLPRCEAASMNASGQIAGSSYSSNGFPARAWRWIAGVFSEVLTLGGTNANAFAINDAGDVTGWADVPSGGNYFAYIFRNGVSRCLGELIGNTSSTGYSINNNGLVAAQCSNIIGFMPRATIASADIGMHDLGTLGGMASFPAAINNVGHICGNSDTGVAGTDQYLPHGFIWRDNVMTDIPPLTGTQRCYLLDINDSDVAVGVSWPASGPGQAHVAINNVSRSLNAMIPTGSGWALNIAYCVNNGGQIAGVGLLNGERRMFLLTPVP